VFNEPIKEGIMAALNFSKMGGLAPAIVQDHDTGEVLMLAFMNQAAWEATLETGKATYYSRRPARRLITADPGINYGLKGKAPDMFSWLKKFGSIVTRTPSF